MKQNTTSKRCTEQAHQSPHVTHSINQSMVAHGSVTHWMNVVNVNSSVNMDQKSRVLSNVAATQNLASLKCLRAASGKVNLDCAKSQRAPILHKLKLISWSTVCDTFSRRTSGTVRATMKQVRRVSWNVNRTGLSCEQWSTLEHHFGNVSVMTTSVHGWVTRQYV